jgi:tetratricopeptide (TPR) repeat protein
MPIAFTKVWFFIAVHFIGGNFFFTRLEMIFLPDILITLTRDTPRTDRTRTALQPLRALLGCGVLILLAAAGYWSARLAWADHLSRSPQLESRERAVLLGPATAVFYERLAESREAWGLDPLEALSRAAQMAPANAEPLLRLALRAELRGDYGLAERSLLQAAECSRLYQPRYLLSQYYFRRKNADEFFRWTRSALEASYGDVRPLLVLAWNLRPDPQYFAGLGRKQRPQVETQFLAFLLRQGESAAAGLIAVHLAQIARPEDRNELLKYCNTMLEGGDPARALEVWNTLCRRKLLPFDAVSPAGPLLTNDKFQWNPSGTGFDWRMEQVPGIETRFVNGEWRTSFSGQEPESCVIGWQYVPAGAAGRHRVQSEVAGIDTNSTGGLNWTMLDGPSPKVVLGYRRPRGSVRIAGTVAIRNLRVEFEQ